MNQIAIEIIRHSINAAQSALDLLETSAPSCDSSSDDQLGCVVFQCEDTNLCSEPVRTQPAVPASELQFSALMEELNHPRWTLRTLSELCEILGFHNDQSIFDLLNRNDVPYVTRRRVSDSAQLVGLLSRN